MKHVMVVGFPRTGGTWISKLLDTAENVKMLWEPDSLFQASPFMRWNLTNESVLRGNIDNFKTHLPNIMNGIEFKKNGRWDTAVYKMNFMFEPVMTPGIQYYDFENVQKTLNAKVVHLIRHPVRFLTSFKRIRVDELSKEFLVVLLEQYVKKNTGFYNMYSDEDWYIKAIHEQFVTDTETQTKILMSLLDLKPGKDFKPFLDNCHKEDNEDYVHSHSIVMTKESVMNRWRTELFGSILEEAKRAGKQSLFKDIGLE